jgi:hypothetical protein
MDRPLCESCIHFDDFEGASGNGHCQRLSGIPIAKGPDEWCGEHHRFPQYLNFVRGREQEAEKEELRKRNERNLAEYQRVMLEKEAKAAGERNNRPTRKQVEDYYNK